MSIFGFPGSAPKRTALRRSRPCVGLPKFVAGMAERAALCTEAGRSARVQGGADLVWLNSVPTREELEQACREVTRRS